jgi:hypothetical protein
LSRQRRIVIHSIAALICLTVAVALVYARNRQYWEEEPYPGGQTAREAVEERPWLETGIADLVRVYSFPLGLMVFVSFYGAFFSTFEIRERRDNFIPVAFLYQLPGFIFALLFIPLFIGMLLAITAFVMSAKKRDKKGIWLSITALAHNAFFALTAYYHLRAWFKVFGD